MYPGSKREDTERKQGDRGEPFSDQHERPASGEPGGGGGQQLIEFRATNAAASQNRLKCNPADTFAPAGVVVLVGSAPCAARTSVTHHEVRYRNPAAVAARTVR